MGVEVFFYFFIAKWVAEAHKHIGSFRESDSYLQLQYARF